MIQTCHFTKNERYHKLFFKAFDHKCVITTSHHIFLQNNYFCRTPLESCFCAWKIWENSRNFLGMMIKVPRFIGEVRILSGTLLFLRNLSGITTFKNIFQQLFLLLFPIQALNAIFKQYCNYCHELQMWQSSWITFLLHTAATKKHKWEALKDPI